MNLDAAKSLDTKGWHPLANPLKYETRNPIDGSFTDAKSAARFQAIKPVDNEILAKLPRSDEEQVNVAAASAKKMIKAEARSRTAPRDPIDVMLLFTPHRPVGPRCLSITDCTMQFRTTMPEPAVSRNMPSSGTHCAISPLIDRTRAWQRTSPTVAITPASLGYRAEFRDQ